MDSYFSRFNTLPELCLILSYVMDIFRIGFAFAVIFVVSAFSFVFYLNLSSPGYDKKSFRFFFIPRKWIWQHSILIRKYYERRNLNVSAGSAKWPNLSFTVENTQKEDCEMSKPGFYESICPRCQQPVGTDPGCTACNWIPKKPSPVDKKPENVPLTDEECTHLGRSWLDYFPYPSGINSRNICDLCRFAFYANFHLHILCSLYPGVYFLYLLIFFAKIHVL